MLDVRHGALVAGIVIYALLGSPTPDHPGMAEAFIGLCLCVAASGGMVGYLLCPQDNSGGTWRQPALFLLIYGLIVPVLAAIAHGQDMQLFFRDLPPFFFLLLPMFCGDIYRKRPEYYTSLLLSFIFLGLIFSLRAIAEAGWIEWDLPYPKGELFYLANAPSVMLACLWLPGAAFGRLIDRYRLADLGGLGAACMAALLPFLAMALSLERAGIGAAVLYGFVLFLMALRRAPGKAFTAAIVPVILLGLFQERAGALLAVLTHKTTLYGLNMRLEEASAAWNAASTDTVTLLFGGGWGTSFKSPAVAEIRVNYTHCLLTATLLKAGLCGLILLVWYLAGLSEKLFAILRRDAVLGLALAAPFLIDVFLYASYKSLDFGLLLLLIAAAPSVQREQPGEKAPAFI